MSEVKVNKISPRTNCGTTQLGDSGDTITVTGDLRSDSLKAADGGVIISQSGTTITIGASGDTVSLASGASQSGFGRSGSVDWQTDSIKTATFTAASGEGYFCNTSGGAFTVNLPAGSAGAIVAISDYTRTFATNNLTVTPNGSEKIGGVVGSLLLNVNGQAITLVYVDGTEGWINVQNAEDTEAGIAPAFVAASGGTVSTCGDFKIHKFTGPGTFTVSNAGNVFGSTDIDYLVVAGGGGGDSTPGDGAGGGAGGFRLSNATCMPAPLTSPLANSTAITASAAAFPITVGGGGGIDTSGSNSVFSTITSAGGGGSDGTNGGSGSGGGGFGNTPPVSPPQGNPGGPGCHAGGGGAGAAGSSFTPPKTGGAGGIGSFVVAAGFAGPGEGTPGPVSNARYFAGGGGGGYPVGSPAGAPGGAGGGGTGAEGAVGGPNGTTNTGGGGGGGGPGGAGNGGSGMVILRYKFQ